MAYTENIMVFNGDSFTYGDELKGYEDNQQDPHTFAYKLAQDHFDKKYVNLATNGSSNSKIFRTTLDFIHKTNKDIGLLCIMWTNWGRFELCENFALPSDQEILIPQECNMNQIIPSQRSGGFQWDNKAEDGGLERAEILKAYTENVLTMHTQIMQGLTYMEHIQWLCDYMGIKLLMGVVHGDMYLNYLHTLKGDGYEDYKVAVSTKMRRLRHENRIGLGHYHALWNISKDKYTLRPNGHADEDAHTDFAEMLFSITEEKNFINAIN